MDSAQPPGPAPASRNVDIARIGPDDWQLFREVRLACLADAPEAFESTYADWVDASEERWRSRLEQVELNLVARVGGEPVGMVSGQLEEAEWVELISMWVAPAVRGAGVAGALIDEVVSWAAGQGRSTYLMVRSANERARKAYVGKGFVDVGVPEGQPADEPAENRMEQRLRS